MNHFKFHELVLKLQYGDDCGKGQNIWETKQKKKKADSAGSSRATTEVFHQETEREF